MLDITRLCYAYPGGTPPVLNEITFTAAEGDLVGVTGPNGTGKTTLLNLIASLYAPTAGTITFLGGPLDAIRRQIALISADFDMFPYLSLEENILFFLAFYRAEYDADDLEYYFERYALADVRHKNAGAASRGMRRKTQIVAALLQSPLLLLADEPLDGLDEAAKEAFREDAQEYGRRGGIGFFALHDRHWEDQLTTKRLELRPVTPGVASRIYP